MLFNAFGAIYELKKSHMKLNAEIRWAKKPVWWGYESDEVSSPVRRGYKSGEVSLPVRWGYESGKVSLPMWQTYDTAKLIALPLETTLLLSFRNLKR